MHRITLTMLTLCLAVSTATAADLSNCTERDKFIASRLDEVRMGWSLHDSLAYVRGMSNSAEQYEDYAWWTRHVYKYAGLPDMRQLSYTGCQKRARDRQQTMTKDPNRY